MLRKESSKEAKLAFGRYAVLQVLGQGAMATVYLANDPNLNRLVAIKVIHGHLDSNKTARTRFWMEARAIAALRNPHIVEIFDYAEKDGNPYIVMEFVDGHNLGKVLDRLNMDPMPQEIAASLVCQAAEALAVAKKHSIVHRDIKPENMMVDVQGYLKVADFGIAHMSLDSLTRTGHLIGTPTYMSPEQAIGKGGVTFQSDIFSLGIVFYQLLTGTRPFKADSIPAVLRKIVEDAHVPVIQRKPSVDPALSGLVDALLNKDPSQRGGGPEWLLGELKHYLVKKEVINPIKEVKLFIDRSFSVGPDFKTAREVDMLAVEIEIARKTGVKTWSAIAPKKFGLSFWKTLSAPKRKRKWIFASIGAALAVLGAAFFFLSGPLQAVLIYDNSRRKEVKSISRPVVHEPLTLTADVTPRIPTPRLMPTTENNLPKVSQRSPAPPVKQTPSLQRPRVSSSNKTPREPAPPSAIRLQVNINSQPPFAEIVANGEAWGMTPIRQKEILSGKYHFQVSFGTRSLDTLVIIQPGTAELWFNDRR